MQNDSVTIRALKPVSKPHNHMNEIVADVENEKPVVRVHCPDCRSTIDTPYGLKHGAKVTCPECRETILFTFDVERVPE